LTEVAFGTGIPRAGLASSLTGAGDSATLVVNALVVIVVLAVADSSAPLSAIDGTGPTVSSLDGIAATGIRFVSPDNKVFAALLEKSV
jgi:hypothetical protein